MRKIEKLERTEFSDDALQQHLKINELVDAVNKLMDEQCRIDPPKQTQEPERKHDVEHCMCCGCVDKRGRIIENMEKPAKNEKVSSENTSEKYSTKDELAERLHRARHMCSGRTESEAKENWSQHSHGSQTKVWGGVADEARRWAVEVVERMYEQHHLLDLETKIELLARLKEGK